MQNIAPHLCSGCGKVGSLLCGYCKYDIIDEPFSGCILCGLPNLNGICDSHKNSIQRAFVVHLRTDVVKVLIDALKFQRVKASAFILAELLNERLPILPTNMLIVPIPTQKSHVRQRGYDQVDLISRRLAHLRSLRYTPLLSKVNNSTQHELSKSDRIVQSRQSFQVNTLLRNIKPGTPCLLLDDIITTGSTVSSAANLLSKHGLTVFVGALAYQPLD